MAVNRPIDPKIYQHLLLQDTPKFSQSGIYGLKTCHLATLRGTPCVCKIRSRLGNERKPDTVNGNHCGLDLRESGIWDLPLMLILTIFQNHLFISNMSNLSLKGVF
jgi:hypothetical protein